MYKMDDIIMISMKNIELEKNIMIEKNIIVKKEMIKKLLLNIKTLNNKVIEYSDKNENDIYKNCTHVFDDYCEKYERTKKICIICDMIQY